MNRVNISDFDKTTLNKEFNTYRLNRFISSKKYKANLFLGFDKQFHYNKILYEPILEPLYYPTFVLPIYGFIFTSSFMQQDVSNLITTTTTIYSFSSQDDIKNFLIHKYGSHKDYLEEFFRVKVSSKLRTAYTKVETTDNLFNLFLTNYKFDSEPTSANEQPIKFSKVKFKPGYSTI